MDAVTSVVSDAIDENKTLSVADVAEVNMGEFRPEDEPTVFTNAPTVQALERIAERLGRTNPHFHWFGSPDAIRPLLSRSSQAESRMRSQMAFTDSSKEALTDNLVVQNRPCLLPICWTLARTNCATLHLDRAH
jgi:hypothetical protein